MVGESILPLLFNINFIEHVAHADLGKSVFDRPVDFVSDVETQRLQEGKSHSKRYSEIIHGVLRLQLLDQLRWARNRHGSVPVQATESVAVGPASTVNSKNLTDLYLTGISDWTETSRSMVERFLTEPPIVIQPPLLSAVPSHSSILLSLLLEMKKSDTERHVSSVVLNICSAALGLRSLLMVCLKDLNVNQGTF